MSHELDIQIACFKEQQAMLASEHHEEFVLIHNESIVGFYPAGGDAYREATTKGLQSGSFLIRQCLRLEEEIPAVFHSRVA